MNGRRIILGAKYADLLEKPLRDRGFSPLFIPDNPFVDPRLSGHADLSLFYCGGSLIAAPYLRRSGLEERLADRGVRVLYADIVQGAEYPMDAALNAKVLGCRLVYSPRVTAKAVAEEFKRCFGASAGTISVRQGYVGCTLCAVGPDAAVTEDAGIAAALGRAGVDVLKVSPGGVRLEGFDHGFIGGAGFPGAAGELFFTGTLGAIPEADRIEEFIYKHGARPVYLSDEAAFDIGGAIIL